MVAEKPLVNRVAASSLITIKLEELLPASEVITFDLKDYLFMELILKEKDFRAALKAHDWNQYEQKYVTINCSVDAIIPIWAYMLVTTYAQPYALDVYLGTEEEFIQQYFQDQIQQLDLEQYAQQRLVIKGCSEKPVPTTAYVELTKRLRPIAKSILFGEPCSTVPIYKQPKKV